MGAINTDRHIFEIELHVDLPSKAATDDFADEFEQRLTTYLENVTWVTDHDYDAETDNRGAVINTEFEINCPADAPRHHQRTYEEALEEAVADISRNIRTTS